MSEHLEGEILVIWALYKSTFTFTCSLLLPAVIESSGSLTEHNLIVTI